MRVIHVTGSAKISTFGTEKEAIDLAIAQKAHGYNVVVAMESPGVFMATCRRHGVPVVTRSGLGLPLEGADESAKEASIRDFMEYIAAFKPDIVHCHSGNAELVAIPASNRANVPCVFTNGIAEVAINNWENGLRAAAICINTATFAKLKNDPMGMGVYYVPNGTKAMPPTKARQTGAAHPPNLVLAGIMEHSKGVDIAILAMVELRRRLGRDCPVLNIYGDGPDREFLASMAAVLELNDVIRFHGFKPGILEHCPSTDIFVLTSRLEAGPLVVLEALSRGMPIVTSDVGDVSEMLPDDRYGRIIPRNAIVAMADAVESLLTDISNGQFNPDLLIERHYSLYSFEKWAERTAEVYKQILLDSAAAVRQAR